MTDLPPDAAEAAPIETFARPERPAGASGGSAFPHPAAPPAPSVGAEVAEAPPAHPPALRAPSVAPPVLVRSEAQLAAALQRAVTLGRR